MPHAPLIHDLALILASAAAASILFSRLKQPVVVGYILAGLLLACFQTSSLPTFISSHDDLKIWADLGVIFVMFHLGLEFSFRRFKKLGLSTLALGFWDVAAMGLIGWLTASALGFEGISRSFVAGAVAISSTTIIMKAFEETKNQGKIFADRVTGLLIFEDLAAVLILVALGSSTTRGISPGELGYLGLELLIVVGGWSLIAGLIVPRVMKHVGSLGSNELLILVALALCLIAAVSAARFHYSMALGAFVIGSILSETSERTRIEHLVRPLRDLFAAVFFVSVGLFTEPAALFQNLPLTFSLLACVLIGKIVVLSSGAILSGQRPKLAVRVGFSMAQIGEFSFIIAALGLSLGVIDRSFQTSIVAVAILTSFLTPYLIRWSERAGLWVELKWPSKWEARLLRYRARVEKFETGGWIPSWIKPGFPRLVLNALLVALIFGGVNRYIWPVIDPVIRNFLLSQTLAFFIALTAASPFIYGMMTAANSASEASGPRSTLFTVFTTVFLGVLSSQFISAFASALMTLGFVLLFSLLFTHRLAQAYHWLEQRFLQGLLQKSPPALLEEQPRLEGFANYEMKSVCVSDSSPWLGKTVQSSHFRERFGASIVVIEREGSTLDPSPELKFLLGDLLWIVGPSEGLRELTQ